MNTANLFLKSDEISRILCVKRAQQGRPLRPPLLYFYSRPCTRGDWLASRAPGLPAGFLLTPLREGRHHGLLRCCRLCLISTRAPTRGATYTAFRRLRLLPQFLLPPLREGRPAVEGFMHYNRIISIHAPTRGTTAIFTKPQVDLYDKLLKNSHFLYTPAFI